MIYKQLLVSGSLAYDYIMSTEQSFRDVLLPEESGNLALSFLVARKEKHLGGTAGNVAYNLNLLLQDPLIVSSLGRDGGFYLEYLTDLGLRTDLIEITEIEDTAAAYILSDPVHSQIAFFHPGAMSYGLQGIDLRDFASSLMLIAPDDVNKMGEYARQCRLYGIDYIFDPGQNTIRFRSEDLMEAIEGTKMLITNRYEWELLKKILTCSEKDLLGRCETVIVTHGETGSEIHRRGRELCRVPSFKVEEVIETTGAGDAYRAGIMAGLQEGWELERGARVGSLLAAYAIGKAGTQNHNPSPEELEKRLGEKIF